jgi:hypothetical protein
LRKAGAATSSSLRALRWAFSAVRRKVSPVLERQEDALGRPFGRLERGQVLAVEGDGAAGDLIAGPAGQAVGQGRLARPVRPHDGVHLARGDLKGQALDDLGLADTDVQVFDRKHCHG